MLRNKVNGFDVTDVTDVTDVSYVTCIRCMAFISSQLVNIFEIRMLQLVKAWMLIKTCVIAKRSIGCDVRGWTQSFLYSKYDS